MHTTGFLLLGPFLVLTYIGNVRTAQLVNKTDTKLFFNWFQRSTTQSPVVLPYSRTCSCSCGEKNEETRIVGGQETAKNEYPWMARLSYFNRFYCGGMLINDRYVLTAAHCVRGHMWFLIKVTVGEHDRCDPNIKPEARFVLRAFQGQFSFLNFENDIALLRLNDVVPITAHIKPICLPRITAFQGQFSFLNFENDIALLRLNDVVPITAHIKPICLPRITEELYVNKIATATGWGTLEEDGKVSCTLQEVNLKVMSNEDCRNTNYDKSLISDKMLCAGDILGGKDTCQGDSGGPLAYQREDQRFELIGIVSWGSGCGRIGYPGVYTRVTHYLNWIIENSQDACYCYN